MAQICWHGTLVQASLLPKIQVLAHRACVARLTETQAPNGSETLRLAQLGCDRTCRGRPRSLGLRIS
jgi:hypothetical protein